MKVVLLAGGLGTRLSEETERIPKPMVEIGGKPIIWHIMKSYSAYGYNEFIICAGYKQNVIKEWFSNYFLYNSDITFNFSDGNRLEIHNQQTEPWKVTIVDTGLGTMTGGRIKRVCKYLDSDLFMMTYGDGVCDVNIHDLLEFHNKHGKIATLTCVRQEQQKGILDIGIDNSVRGFREKNIKDSMLINAGYMVLDKEVLNYIDGDDCVFEKDVMERLVEEKQLMSYNHEGFWQCMDTQHEKEILENMWQTGHAPWKCWE